MIVAVVAISASLGILDFKMMGVGLAVAVLLDATIVRAGCFPATMKLLGGSNWYLPSSLDKLPRVTAEPAAGPTPAQQSVAAPAPPGRRDQFGLHNDTFVPISTEARRHTSPAKPGQPHRQTHAPSPRRERGAQDHTQLIGAAKPASTMARAHSATAHTLGTV